MKIEHIAIWTKDLDRLRDFYVRYFDAHSNTIYKNPAKQFSSYFLSFDSGARLEIMQKKNIPDSRDDPYLQATGLTHLAFSVGSAEKVDQLTNKLREDGYDILDGPRETGDGYYESVVLDPDNNRIEITT